MTRRLVLASLALMMAVTGSYVLVYLFRWEWHRAIITGLFFVAAELGLVAMILLRRLAAIEVRLDQIGAATGPDAEAARDVALARLREGAPEPTPRFRWLDPSEGATNVFLPFLLGVGAVASATAWVVEQVARRTALPVLERRIAESLVPLAPPAGGLVGPVPPPTPAVPSHRLATAVAVLGVLGATVAATGALDAVADAIQTRPDPVDDSVQTTIELQLLGEPALRNPQRRATELWGSCSHVLHNRGAGATIEQLGAGRVSVVVPTSVGGHGEARVRGCLQDALVDKVQARVVSIHTTTRPDGDSVEP